MSGGPTGTINWSLASPVANRVAGTYPLADTYHTAHLQNTLPDIVKRAAVMVTAETGLKTPGDPEVMVVSRADWTKRNLATFSHLLAPLESKIAEKLEESGSRGTPALVARQVVAIEDQDDGTPDQHGAVKAVELGLVGQFVNIYRTV